MLCLGKAPDSVHIKQLYAKHNVYELSCINIYKLAPKEGMLKQVAK